jgi:F0F1-type ATP synthase delta subunit
MSLSVDEYLAGLLTREEINGFLSEVELMGDAVYKIGEGSLSQLFQSGIGAKSAQVILGTLDAAGKLEDKDYQKQFFEGITKKLKEIPILNLELAFEPTRELLAKIKDTWSEYLGKPIAIDYKVDTKIMGGARLAFMGKYFDFTLDAKWPEIWAVVREKLRLKT